MQSRNPFFADMADLMTDAFSAAQAAGEEARAVFRARAERMAGELDLVAREEFEAVRAQAAAAAEEVESLKARLEKLEAENRKKPAARKSTGGRKTTKKSSN